MKKLLLVFLACLMVVSFCSCGGSEDKPNLNEEQNWSGFY